MLTRVFSWSNFPHSRIVQVKNIKISSSHCGVSLQQHLLLEYKLKVINIYASSNHLQPKSQIALTGYCINISEHCLWSNINIRKKVLSVTALIFWCILFYFPDYKKTSMKQSVDVFERFVTNLEKTWKGKLLEQSGKLI